MKMKTKNKLTVIILSSIVCLLPLVLAIVLYKDLPDQIIVQWNSEGEPTNIVPKAVAAFALPSVLMILNIISKLRLYSNPKKENVPNIMLLIVEWIIPIVSLVFVPITLFIAMDINIPITLIAPVFIGILFILFGNYLPKSRQNYVVGIKLPWTLHDADNWNKTHRIAGYLWIFGGIVYIICAFIVYKTSLWIAFVIVITILIVVIPCLYSYLLYKKSENHEYNND